MHTIIVSKFGGTSVANLHCWQNIHSIIQDKLTQYKQVLLVCSAPAKVSNLLENALKQAVTRQHQNTIEQIRQIYVELAKMLGINAETLIATHFKQLDEKLLGIALLQELSPRIHAHVMAFGELLLSHLGSLYLNKH